MPKRKQYFVLDVNKNYRNIMLQAKQMESCEIHIALEEDKKPYFFNGNIQLYSKNSNNEIISFKENSKDGNDLFFDLTFETEGIYEFELELSSDDGILKTPTFFGLIKKSISGGGVEYNLLDSEGNQLIDSEGFLLKVRG